MSRGGQCVVVLCEDETQFNFARHFLLLKDVVKTSGQIRPVVAPKGQGSGEHFVRKNLPSELHENRNRNRRGDFTLLFVLIDADTVTAQERERQLSDECLINPLTHRDGYIRTGEQAAVFIPRRNIDTWLELLDGQPVDETSNYKHGTGARSCKPQVEALFTHCQQQQMPAYAVASLHAACAVYRNVLALLPQP